MLAHEGGSLAGRNDGYAYPGIIERLISYLPRYNREVNNVPTPYLPQYNREVNNGPTPI